MENLWPVDLVSHPSTDESAWDIFTSQAAALPQASRGMVHAEVRHRDTSIGRSSSMVLYPTSQPEKGYEFMAIRSADKDFPVALEVFHLGEAKRIWQARNASDLRRSLREIFAAKATLRIVRNLADESEVIDLSKPLSQLDQAAEGGALDQCDSVKGSSTSDNDESPRSIAVGGLIHDKGKTFATVMLLGISGFVIEEVLKKLVLKPDAKGAAINSLNGRYVVDIAFLGGVKLTLSAEETKVLQKEIARVLTTVQDPESF